MNLNQFLYGFVVCFFFSNSLDAQYFDALDPVPHDIGYLRDSKLSTPKIKVTYGRPTSSDPKIFGTVVPYEEVWRTGANEATEIKFYQSVYFGNTFIKAGTYSLYTIPNKDRWQVLLNTQTDVLGAHFYDPTHTIASITIEPILGEPLNTFSIGFKELGSDKYKVVLAWGTTRIAIPIEFDKNERLKKYTTLE